jgi:DNA-binding response OmpR family regulator
LKNDGYETVIINNPLEVMNYLKKNNVDLAVIDVMMPGMNGIDLCLSMRKVFNFPIIMLSAKSQDFDKIHGLTSGADDYITKPFNPIELIVRVKSQLRRFKQYRGEDKSPSSNLAIGELQLNVETRQVLVGEREVRLTPKEFDILELLLRNKCIVMSIEKIYESVWNEPYLNSENTVMVHINKIREKIEHDSKNPHYIKTVWGTGYKI